MGNGVRQFQFGLPVWLDYLVSFVLAMIAVGLLAAALSFIGFERYLRDLIGSFILSLGLLLLLEGVFLSLSPGHHAWWRRYCPVRSRLPAARWRRSGW